MTSAAVGFQKLAFSPRLTGAALGGTLGFAASPEDEGQAAGLTGAALGYGAGALADHLHKRVAGTPGPAKGEGAAVPKPAGPPAATHSPAELAAAHAEIERTLDPHKAMAHFDQQMLNKPPEPSHAGLSPERAKSLAKIVAPARARGRPLVLPRAFGKVGFEKLSDYSAGTGVGPLSVGVSSKDERLPGMNRWVPRGTIEDAYQGLQQGLDQQALMEQAAASGNMLHPAVGAGLAAALARFGLGPEALGRLGGSSRAGVGLAALAGGGAGALYNQLTAKRRVGDMAEAVKGVQGEQEGMGHHTAREAMPMVVSGAGSNQ